MNQQNFATSILVDQSPAEVFNAVNNPRGWWSVEIEGNAEQLNTEWTYRFGESHRTRLKTIEIVPDKKVVWLIEDNYFKNPNFEGEWTGNKISFDISREGDKTQLTFTQIGLVPTNACYDVCQGAWTGFVQRSLRNLIATGKGELKWYEKK